MPDITEIIKKRLSCRTYSDRPIEDKVLKEFSFKSLRSYRAIRQSTEIQINHGLLTLQEWKKLGTYGIINGLRFSRGQCSGRVIWRWKTTDIVRRI